MKGPESDIARSIVRIVVIIAIVLTVILVVAIIIVPIVIHEIMEGKAEDVTSPNIEGAIGYLKNVCMTHA